MAAELLMAAAFLLTAWRFWFILADLVDLRPGLYSDDFVTGGPETSLIPDRFIIAGIVWYFGVLTFAEEGKGELLSGLAGGLSIGVGMLLLSLLFDKVTGKESLGGGDIKLFFMTGLYLGPWVGLFNLILSLHDRNRFRSVYGTKANSLWTGNFPGGFHQPSGGK